MTRRRLLGPIAALVTFAVLGGSGAAVAVWTTSASVSATASSATIATTVTPQLAALNTTYRYASTTSSPVTGSLAIANTGGAPLTYTLANQVGGNADLAQKTTLRLWTSTGTCGATPPVGAAVVKTTLADTAPALPETARTVAPGAAVTVCVSTQIEGVANAAVPNQTVTATLTVTGAVGSNWKTSTGAPTITQTTFVLQAPGAPTCTPLNFVLWNGFRLTWSAPANRAGSSVAYRVIDQASGTAVASVTSSSDTVSLDLNRDNLTSNGTYQLRIEARDTISGTTALAGAPVTVTRSGFILLNYDC